MWRPFGLWLHDLERRFLFAMTLLFSCHSATRAAKSLSFLLALLTTTLKQKLAIRKVATHELSEPSSIFM
jgi:hypothetical protein